MAHRRSKKIKKERIRLKILGMMQTWTSCTVTTWCLSMHNHGMTNLCCENMIMNKKKKVSASPWDKQVSTSPHIQCGRYPTGNGNHNLCIYRNKEDRSPKATTKTAVEHHYLHTQAEESSGNSWNVRVNSLENDWARRGIGISECSMEINKGGWMKSTPVLYCYPWVKL